VSVPNTLKARMARGDQSLIVSIGRILHHNLVQIIAMKGGIHGIWFDLEHIDFATADLEIGVLAARAHGVDTFVRMPKTTYHRVTQVLEAGVGGLMAAQIKTLDEAREFAEWCRFAPLGSRGLNTLGYDAGYGTLNLPQFIESANRQAWVGIQIETVEALECVEQIAALSTVDFLFLGPADLSVALGVPGEFLHPKCTAAIERIGRACANHGKGWGVVPFGPEHTDYCVAHGCRMLSVGADVRILNLGIESMQQGFAKYFSK
jgi:4-hydroxy-2-oxoheptanedioate aldolase